MKISRMMRYWKVSDGTTGCPEGDDQAKKAVMAKRPIFTIWNVTKEHLVHYLKSRELSHLLNFK
jgi:hypothetical protein